MGPIWEGLPEECWESIVDRLQHQRHHFESLSLVCKRFLSITNRLQSSLTISDPTVQVRSSVLGLLHRFPHLKRIDLVCFNGDLDRLIIEISRSGLKLQVLNLSNQKRFPVAGMRELGKKMDSLRTLICSRFQFLQDRDLIAIADSFPLLEDIDISYPEQDFGSFPVKDSDLFPGTVTDAGILALASKLRNLRSIDLSGNHFISDKALTSLSSNCVFLSKISARHCVFVSQDGIFSVIRKDSNLNSLSIDGNINSIFSPLTDRFLIHARALTSLDLSQMVILDDSLFAISEANLPLKKLVLSDCRGFTFTGISAILQIYQSLLHLDLQGADFLTDESMMVLVRFLRHLISINLNSCCHLTNSTFAVLAKICPSLEEIQMERTSLGKEDFPTDLQKNYRIQTLKLSWNKMLCNETLKEIGTICCDLKAIDVSHCWNITDDGVGEIGKRCREITELGVNRCGEMTNLGMAAESGFSKMEVLRAAGSGIRDEGLSMIGRNCRWLYRLDLEGCLGITERGVKEVVGNCKVLREVNLKGCCNVGGGILARLVFSRASLRKIISPVNFYPTAKQKDFFLRHGCVVYG